MEEIAIKQGRQSYRSTAGVRSTSFERSLQWLITGRSSGSRIDLLTAPSRHPLTVAVTAFVPGYSGGTATDLHRFPYSPRDNFSLGTRIAYERTQPASDCQIISGKIFTANKFMPENQNKREELFPLNRAGGLRTDIVDNTIHAADAVDDAGRNPL